MADRRATALRLVDHVRVIEAKKGPTTVLTPPLNFPRCNTVSRLRSSSSDVVNHDLNLVLHGKSVVAFGKVVRTTALLSPVAKLQ